jgi:hypothetical protein
VPLTARMLLAERGQAEPDYLQIVGGQQLLRMQHFNMRQRCGHVITDQPLVEGIVLARRVLQHTAVEWRALVPQPAHGPRSVELLRSLLLGRTQRVHVGNDQCPRALVGKHLPEDSFR